jgi:histidinol-phosphate aminotransferase
MTARPPKPRPSVDLVARPDWTRSQRPLAPLNLDKNENTDPVLLALIGRLAHELPASAVVAYPDTSVLYQRLSEFLSISPTSLLLTAGSDGAIRAVFEAFVLPGERVLFTDPSFAMYAVYAAMFGAEPITLRYRPSDQGPILDPDHLVELIGRSRPRLVCLPNPDSPTGTVLLEPAMLRIAEAACDAGTVLLVDEAYYPFHPWTALPWIDRFDNLVVTRTFTKAWGLAGSRVGFAAACPRLTAILHKVRPMYEINGVGLALAARLLDHAEEVERSVVRLLEGKAAFVSDLTGLGFRTLPTAGNFLHVAFGDRAPAIHAALAGRVAYRLGFDAECLAGFSRFTITTSERFAEVTRLIEAANRR